VGIGFAQALADIVKQYLTTVIENKSTAASDDDEDDEAEVIEL